MSLLSKIDSSVANKSRIDLIKWNVISLNQQWNVISLNQHWNVIHRTSIGM